MSNHTTPAPTSAPRPSYFDTIASTIASSSESSTAHFEQTWSSHLGNSYLRATPRNTGKGPGLLDLPPELRLMIYGSMHLGPHLTATGEGAKEEGAEAIDIAALLNWKKLPASEMTARNPWNWILTHPLFFTEALDSITQRHAVLLRSLEGVTLALPYLTHVKTLILDFAYVHAIETSDALDNLRNLPNLEILRINTTPSTLPFCRSPAPLSGFSALHTLTLHNVSDEAEERADQAAHQLRMTKLEAQLAAANENLQAARLATAGVSLNPWQKLQQMQLQLDRLDIDAEIVKLRLAGVEGVWGSGAVRDSRIEARRGRRRGLRRREIGLRVDLGLGGVGV
ncbi:hypothetical protein CLAFUW4_13475 [Fulvia fulva]|uniref:Uncharacterized protein n=1 Tax=Passalora fulva TaxID=5499 RepID=A0A9Q8PJT8_PASFU|nr:uncharacterized protein CLAFUR5_13328 [Fulvia fulva]KAK4612243.1 hypothetical protein CLAFUR4_13478 [Fulvia fulva]KAK4612410.1 hypothetical protein CLAFUR0_13486 [Fulvia fulva]UJO23841.1 hypothetical protein CLAFUR5_13328 [Fulvia fulva]WPV21265.1 hypothetical protein CLAFUW4_13475 [Fulvia fulva]WPV35962.1 hypothetical protein CLAFUW7_13482 [Fulvia fulva]